MSVTSELAWELRMARLAAGLSQDDVAAHLGVTRWAYNRAENGHRHLSDDWIDKLPEEMRRPINRFQRILLLRQLDEIDRKINDGEPVRRIRRPVGAVRDDPLSGPAAWRALRRARSPRASL